MPLKRMRDAITALQLACRSEPDLRHLCFNDQTAEKIVKVIFEAAGVQDRRRKPQPPNSKRKVELTHDLVKQRLVYDEITGVFTWRTNWYKVLAGQIAGVEMPDGYWRISIYRNQVLAHRLAWFYIHGAWPKGEIDHINGNRSDNRIVNLRVATRRQQLMNQKLLKRNKSGYKGVHFVKDVKKWNAQIKIDGKSTSLGFFDDPKEAHAAYVEAAERAFDKFARSK